MGSSHSQPASPATSRAASPEPPRRTPLAALRRFSALGRPDDIPKRSRHRSPGSVSSGKKPRLEELSVGDDETSQAGPSNDHTDPTPVTAPHEFPARTDTPDPRSDGPSLSRRRQSLPLSPSFDDRSVGNRLSAFLGFSTPPPPSAPPAEDLTVEQLQERIATAREDLAETRRLLDETQARIDGANRRRSPHGAVLMIQGLAQTHTSEDTPRPRRSSDSNVQRPRAPEDNTSLETQARMIGGLLTVAAAATATTLLAPHTPPPAGRSNATSAIENVLSRVRPGRLRSSQTVESALGNYLRTVLRDARRLDPQPMQISAETGTTVSNDFQRFLETLQGDLVGAVREFADPSDATDDMVTIAGTDTSEIPTFHHQVGQVQPATSSGVSSIDSVRRLNFFRAHTFPAMPPLSDDDPDAVVPCIFIAVRSIRHNPTMSTEDLVRHPSFPFVDGNVPADDGQPAVVESTRRSLRQRFMDRLSSREPTRPNGPLNTYLVSVIGGNYPRSHPVLAIPNLVTGGPLTGEEMQLVGELMGPVKPPTATVDEIENAGLRIVDGSEMANLAEQGDMLDSCVDKCLICLSEYEQGEQCRVLNCRHGYHKECVDQWLSKGSNSCPACRTEAVDKKPVIATTDHALNIPHTDSST